MWTCRNEAHHGKTWAISLEERANMMRRIKMIYEVVKPVVLEEDKWLFSQSEKVKIGQSYPKQLGWVQQVEMAYGDILVEHAEDGSTSNQINYSLEVNRHGHNYLL